MPVQLDIIEIYLFYQHDNNMRMEIYYLEPLEPV